MLSILPLLQCTDKLRNEKQIAQYPVTFYSAWTIKKLKANAQYPTTFTVHGQIKK
jgi:hypothetical protein